MKCLFVTSYYNQAEGGADISTKLLAEGITKRGINVRIASINAHKQNGVVPLLAYFPLPTALIAFLLNTQFLDAFLVARLQRVIKKVKPDMLHVHDIMLLPASLRACRKAKIPVITTIRDLRFVTNIPILRMEDLSLSFSSPGISLSYLAQQKGWLAALLAFPFVFFRPRTLRKALKKADMIVAISQFVKNQLVAHGISEEKISVIHNSMPQWEKMKQKKNTTPIFFAPGRLEYYKGFHLLIRAMKEVREQNGKAKLLIAGEGPEEKKLKAMVKKFGLEQCVCFLGKLSYDEIKRYYFLCDAVLFPSLWPEALGRIPLEAMAAGKPCIATNVGGIPEIVPKRFLVQPTAYAFAEKMMKLVRCQK